MHSGKMSANQPCVMHCTVELTDITTGLGYLLVLRVV